MRFPGRNTYVSVVEKVHFQESDIFAMSKRRVPRETTSHCPEKPHRPQDPSENLPNPLGIHDVFKNVPVATAFFYDFQLAKPGKFMHF